MAGPLTQDTIMGGLYITTNTRADKMQLPLVIPRGRSVPQRRSKHARLRMRRAVADEPESNELIFLRYATGPSSSRVSSSPCFET